MNQISTNEISKIYIRTDEIHNFSNGKISIKGLSGLVYQTQRDPALQNKKSLPLKKLTIRDDTANAELADLNITTDMVLQVAGDEPVVSQAINYLAAGAPAKTEISPSVDVVTKSNSDGTQWLWGGIGLLVLGGASGGGGAAGVPVVPQKIFIAGNITLGSAVAGLKIEALDASGNVVASNQSQDKGQYFLTLDIKYAGQILTLRVTDTDYSDGLGYTDEATGLSQNITVPIRAKLLVSASASGLDKAQQAQITPLTELAVREIEDAKVQDGTVSEANLVQQINQTIGKLFGVTDVVHVSAPQVVSITQSGDTYGQALALLSGLDALARKSGAQNPLSTTLDRLSGVIALNSDKGFQASFNEPAQVTAALFNQAAAELQSLTKGNQDLAAGLVSLISTVVTAGGTKHPPTVTAALVKTANEGSSTVSLDLLINASDVDGDTLTVTNLSYKVGTGASSNTVPTGLSLSADGKSLTLDPANQVFNGLKAGATLDIVASYTISDGQGGSVAQTAKFTVTGTNDVPTAQGSVAAQTAVKAQPYSLDVASYFADLDEGDSRSYTLTGPGATGLSIDANGKITGTLGSTRDAQSVTVTLTDGGQAQASQTFSLRVVETAPIVQSIGLAPSQSGNVKSQSTVQLAVKVSEAVTVSGTAAPTLTLTINGQTATATYQSGSGTSTLVFSVTVPPTEGNAVSITAIGLPAGTTIVGQSTGQSLSTKYVGQSTTALTIDSTSPNITTPAALNVAEKTTAVFATLSATDAASVNWSLAAGGTNNDLFSLTADGQLRLKAAKNYQTDARSYSILVQAMDVAGNVSTKAITVNLTNINDAPTVTAALVKTAKEGDGVVSLNLLSNASDVDGDTLTVTKLSYKVGTGASSNTVPTGLSLSADGKSLTLDPANQVFNGLKAGATLDIVASYTISDGQGGSVAQTAKFTVTGTNDVPTVTALVKTAKEGDGVVSLNLLSNASDVDGDTLTVTKLSYKVGIGASSNTVPTGLSLSADGKSLTLDPANQVFNGLKAGATLDIVASYTISDGQGGSVAQTAKFTVAGTNDAAVISGQTSLSLTESNEAQSISGQLTITDLDGIEENTFISQTDIRGSSGYGKFSISSNGLWQYQMDHAHDEFSAGLKYVDTATVQAIDGTQKTLTVTITGTKEDTVIVSESSVSVDENTTTSFYQVMCKADASSSLTYSIGGNDAALFDIDTFTGKIKFKISPNYENPKDVDINNIYVIDVRVYDGFQTVSKNLTINLKDVNESPTLTNGLQAITLREVKDASANISTSYTLSAGQPFQGSISSFNDKDWFKIELTEGKNYSFALTGYGTQDLANPQLILRNSNGIAIGSNDNGLPGSNSVFNFNPASSGTYYIEAGASFIGTGAYALSFNEGSKASVVADMGANILKSDYLWSGFIPGQGGKLTYGFRATAPVTTTNSSEKNTFGQLNDIQKTAVRKALETWSDVCGIQFEEQNTIGYTNDATILFGTYFNNTDGAAAYAYLPGNIALSAHDGDVWLNRQSFLSSSSINFGGFEFHALVHEIGHVLGLSHPGLYNANGATQFTYSNSASIVQDTHQYTIESYFDERNSGAEWYEKYTSTPMLFDVLAAQNLYGPNLDIRSGDTVYGCNSTAGERFRFDSATDRDNIFCIVDAGGIDTLDTSKFSAPQTIRIAPGSFSDCGWYDFGNVSIALDTWLENIISGTGNDFLVGNSLDNTIIGGLGDDVLFGAAGIDTAVINGLRENYKIGQLTSGGISISGPDGSDVLFNVEQARFQDQTVVFENLFGSSYNGFNYNITDYEKLKVSKSTATANGWFFSATATDEDAVSHLSYGLSGVDASLFDLNASNGQLKFKNLPTYDKPLDVGGDNIYDVVVWSSDGQIYSNALALAIYFNPWL